MNSHFEKTCQRIFLSEQLKYNSLPLSRLRNRMSPTINKRGERGECTFVKDIGLVIRGPASVRTRNIFRFSYDLGCCYTFVSSLKLR